MSLYQYDPKNAAQQVNQKSFFSDQQAYNYEDERPQDRLQPAPAIEQPKRTSSDIIREIFSYTPPKPTYDPNRPEEIKRRMKLNAFGQGLSVLGDMLSLGKGGNVVARTKDTTNDQLQSYLYDYTDRAARANDEWNYRDYMNKVKQGLTELDQMNTENTMDFNKAKLSYDINKDNQDFALKARKTEADILLAQEKQKATEAYNQAMIAFRNGNYQLGVARLQEAQRHNQAMETKESGSQSAKDFIYTQSGQPIQLGPDEKYQLFSMILQNTPLEDADMDLLSPKMGEPVSTNVLNMLIQKYAPKVPAVNQYIRSKYGVELNPIQAPQPQTQQTPQDTTKPKNVPLLFQ